MGLVGVAPVAQRLRVVAAQVLHVEGFEPALLHGLQRQADVRQLAVGEHVAVDEVAAAVRHAAALGVGRGDAVVHDDAVVGQQLLHALEVLGQVLAAHVLEHADAGDAVELARHVAVVLQADLDAVLQAGGLHALGREVELVLRQRDAHAARAELLRRADHQRAPAAADVEQRLPGLEFDLGEDVVDFLQLRGGQVFVAVLEVGARIDHVRIEPELVERVRHVVVVLDGFLVRRLGVREVAGHALQRAAGLVERGLRQAVGDVDHVAELAFDVDLALDVGLAQVVERGLQHQRQRRGRFHVQRDRRSAEVTEVVGLAVPQGEPRGQVGPCADRGAPLRQLLFPKHASLRVVE
ncbi:hypothetical protein D3C87_542200 [compost metagenome]